MPDLPIVAPNYEEPVESAYEDLRHCLHNCTTLNRESLTEAVGAAMRAPLLLALRWAELALVAAALAVFVLTLEKGAGWGPTLEAALFLGLVSYFFVWQQLLMPRKLVKQELRRQILEEGQRGVENHLFFTDKNVAKRVGDDGEVLHMDYARIKALTETERFIVLTTRHNRVLPLDKRRFDNGGPQDFWKRISEKAPDAKIYRV